MNRDYIIHHDIERDFTSKLACFSLDHTLVETKSGSQVTIDECDWRFMPYVVETLRNLYANGWSIVVFTNQTQNAWSLDTHQLTSKFNAIQNEVGVPMTIFASLQSDLYRKAFTGMWELFEMFFDKYDTAFYCGNTNTYTDMYFAKNVGLPFAKPCDIFTTQLPHYERVRCVDVPHPIHMNWVSQSQVDDEMAKVASIGDSFQYLFVIGPPASGKSHFCKTYLPSFVRLSKDDFKTKAQYLKRITAHANERLVFDNTNHTAKSRDEIKRMLPENARIGYIYREMSKEECMYLNKYRYFTSNYQSALLPDVAIHTSFKNMELPETYIHLSHWIGSLPSPFWV